MKRLTAYVEITFPADDPRSFDDLKSTFVVAVDPALYGVGGRLASATFLSASGDPVEPPEVPSEPAPPAADPVPSEPPVTEGFGSGEFGTAEL